MKKFLLFFAFAGASVFWSGAARAQDHGLGVGVVVGEPTGVNAKLWVGDRSALDLGFGLSVGGDRIGNKTRDTWSRFHLHADYLYHFFDVIRSSMRMPLYFGAGPRFNFGGNYGASFGLRGVAGIDWLVEKYPIDVFLEVAPVFQVGYDVGVGLEGGVGVRYFF
jgi:hypothetical protein